MKQSPGQDQAGKTFDVLVVGSGASGGWVAKRLTEAGVRVALLDAGRAHSPADYREHTRSFDLKYRDRAPDVIRRTRPVQKDCYACREANYEWFVNDLDEPYTTPHDKPFSWQGRMRIVGGRTNVWGRQSYRLSEQDLKGASFDGHGDDWPVGYADLAPYYDLVEEYVGITGIVEGIEELPDGRFHPAMGMSCAETQLRTRVKQKLGRTITLGRAANITKPINGRLACHYCGPCELGCATRSYFNSAFTTVADAVATGRCTLVTNAMVHRVLMDDERNRATGVLYIDRVTRQAREIHGRIVVLCAQALESARMLFNSSTRQYADGLANTSGVLGKYLQDHLWVAGGASGDFPDLPVTPNVDGPRRPNGLYVIRFRNTKNGPRYKKFLRGYGFQGGATVNFNFNAAGFGEAFKQGVRQGTNTINLSGFGEALARRDNYVELDPNVVDTFGIPVLRIHMSWSENEKAMIPDMAESAAEMLEAAGAKNIRPWMVPDRVPGMGIHEVGVARMGNNARTSVLNQFQQTHDVKNLFVMDGSCFVSSGCQNPTLTIMALAVRSTDYLMEQMKSGSL